MQTPDVVREVLAFAPALAGLSMVFTGRAREFVALAGALREAGWRGHLTAGGHFASFHAEDLLRDFPAFDSVVHGEGEETITDLAAHLDEPDRVRGISFRAADGAVVTTAPRANPADLDSRPAPMHPTVLHSYMGWPIANVLSSRGCFGNCNFCSISAWYRRNQGPRFRQRDVCRVAREMGELYRVQGARIFNFHDDNFFLASGADSLRRFRALRDALAAEGIGRIALQIKARPDSITPRAIRLLRRMGLFRVFLGVESNAVAGLRTLGRGIRREQNHVAMCILLDAGLHLSYNLLMFDPETTPADLRDNIAFMRAYPQVPMNFGRVEVYTGTPLHERLSAEGRLTGDYFGYSYRIADERVQRAFDAFKTVFLPRNFQDDGLNLAAMRLDYHFHLLRHFRPRRADGGLEREVKGLIAELNADNAGLLERIVADVCEGGADDCAVRTLAADLRRARERCDDAVRPHMAALIAEINDRATRRRMSTRPGWRLAPIAAAALVAAALGCDSHATEPMPKPGRTGDQQPSDKLPEADAAKVQQVVLEKYKAAVQNLAERREIAPENIEVRLRLTLDGKGGVSQCVLLNPEGKDWGTFPADLRNAALKWTFPSVASRGTCTVAVPITMFSHMHEMMMRPMDGDDGKAAAH